MCRLVKWISDLTWMRRLFKLMTTPSAWQVSDLDRVTADLSRDLTRSACVLDIMTSVVADLSCAMASGVVLVAASATTSNQPSMSMSIK